MGFFFLLFLGLLLLSILPKPSVDTNGKLIVKREKKCPPHRWFWQEIVDQNGVKQGERMMCKDCGPLRPINGGDE